MAKLEYLRDGYRMKAGDQFEVHDKKQVEYLVKNKIAKVVDEKHSPAPIEGKNPNEPHTQEAPKPEAMSTASVVEPEDAKPTKPIEPKPATPKPATAS